VPRSYRNEIASYLIDRLLGIGLVPATVERPVYGVPGSLQIWLDTAVDEPLLEIYNKTDLLDGLEDQLSRARAFMAVMDVYEAHPSIGLMLLPHEKQLQVADVTKAFSTSTKLNPDMLNGQCPPISPKRRLEFLEVSHSEIKREVGEYLSDEQIKALLARRDLILNDCGEPESSVESGS